MSLPHRAHPKLAGPATLIKWHDNPHAKYTECLEGRLEDGRTIYLFKPDFTKHGMQILDLDHWTEGSYWDAKAGYVWRMRKGEEL